MIETDRQSLPTYYSAEEILSQPRFSEARDAYVRAVLGVYEHNPFLNRLLAEAGRGVLFIVIMCLYARYDESDRATWPTLRRVTDATKSQGVTGARRIPSLVTRLIETGYIELRASPRDRRIRILAPTKKMQTQDQDWLVAHYVPLQMLFPDPGYARIMGRDPAFQLAHRQIAVGFFSLGAQIIADHPIVMQFMSHEAGIMILIKLMQLGGSERPPSDVAGGATTSKQISFSDIGARFGVSRTHVRTLLEDGEQQGFMHLTKNGGQFVQLTREIVDAFDRFVAAGMSGHDLIYKLALRSLP